MRWGFGSRGARRGSSPGHPSSGSAPSTPLEPHKAFGRRQGWATGREIALNWSKAIANLLPWLAWPPARGVLLGCGVSGATWGTPPPGHSLVSCSRPHRGWPCPAGTGGEAYSLPDGVARTALLPGLRAAGLNPEPPVGIDEGLSKSSGGFSSPPAPAGSCWAPPQLVPGSGAPRAACRNQEEVQAPVAALDRFGDLEGISQHAAA